jgi:hypothetical protein
VSITVPTAEDSARDESTGPSPKRGRIGLLVFAGVIVAFVVGMWAGEERITAPSTGPIESPTGGFPESEQAADRSMVYPEFSQEVFFPGNGEFTALARSIHGYAAIGRQFIGSGGFVWTADPTAEEWTRRQIEVAERAYLGDVVAFVDGFYIGGAIVGPGMGSSIPTLWGGSVDRDFTVVDHPFAGPGRIDALRVIGGELYVIGQGSAPFSDTLRPGTARVPRLVAQRTEGWVDLTPTGSNVIVTDVVGFDDGIVAAGADADQALVWWQADSAADCGDRGGCPTGSGHRHRDPSGGRAGGVSAHLGFGRDGSHPDLPGGDPARLGRRG